MEQFNDFTISEQFTLPSKGLMYSRPVNPHISLRAMTTAEEMRRLSPTETPYKVMCEIIQDCIVGEKLGIPVYDLALCDYQFLLHKLRIVTYGPEYKMSMYCPYCGQVSDTVINLDELDLVEYTEDFEELRKVFLPVCKKEIEIKLQTPRTIDEVNARIKEIKKRNKELSYDPSLLVTLQSVIKTVDGQVPNPVSLEGFVKKLSMRDANILLQQAKKLNGKVGLNTECVARCAECGYEAVTTFRYSSEFFGPTID